MKKTNLFATMMVTLGVAFMNCNIVEAETQDICGLYTITLSDYDHETMRFGDVTNRFNVEISCIDDTNIEVLLTDPIDDYNMGYYFEKVDSNEYEYYNADGFDYWIEKVNNDWYLYIDRYMKLDPITIEDFAVSYTSDMPGKHPVGLYDYDGVTFMVDTFVGGGYQLLYTNKTGEVITEVLTEDRQYIDGYEYTTFTCDLGILFTYDQNDFSDFAGIVFSGSDECTILEKLDFDYYDDIYLYDGAKLIASCEVNGEYEIVYIDFSLNTDEYGYSCLDYTICFDKSDEIIYGSAILTTFGSQIISNDFLIDTVENIILIPMVSGDIYECNMAWC